MLDLQGSESGKPNLGKQAAIYAVMLLISLGLCGYSWSGEGNMGAGLLGMAGIGIGGIGLLVTGIRAISGGK